MSSTTFIDGQTKIVASWLNDVNEAVYNPSQVFRTANFTIEEDAGKLVFKYQGTAIASLDSSGNLIAHGTVTGGGTP